MLSSVSFCDNKEHLHLFEDMSWHSVHPLSIHNLSHLHDLYLLFFSCSAAVFFCNMDVIAFSGTISLLKTNAQIALILSWAKKKRKIFLVKGFTEKPLANSPFSFSRAISCVVFMELGQALPWHYEFFPFISVSLATIMGWYSWNFV